jgi:hypothetical protein
MTRPKISEGIIEEAARLTSVEMCEHDATLDEEELAEAIVESYSHHMNGFELAKEMDDDGWGGITAMFVESLDMMSDFVREVHAEAQRKWAAWQNIKPPHPIGTLTTRGEITGISEYHPAAYAVKEPGQVDGENGTRRLIVNFEDVVLAQP